MRLIFFGSSDFSIPFIESINSSRHEIVKVFTGSDKKTGRGRKIVKNPVKKFSIDNNLEYYTLDRFSDGDIRFLKKLKFDCAIVVSFGRLLPGEILLDKEKRFINVHPSDLPKYRGPSPIESTIIEGEEQTAVTIMDVSNEMDEGDILAKTIFGIGKDENKDSVLSKHIRFGKNLLIDVIDIMDTGELKPIKQNHKRAKYTKLFKKSDYRIDWQEGSYKIYNKIRAFSSKPGAYAFLGNKRIQIIEARLLKNSKLKARKDIFPGTVIEADRNNGIMIYIGNDCFLKILKIKPEGKKNIDYKDFLNGYGLKTGDRFT